MARSPIHVRSIILIAWLTVTVLLSSAGTSVALTVGGGISPQISIAVSNGFSSVNYTTAGFPIGVDVFVTAKDATPFEADVYVGIVAPNGPTISLIVGPGLAGIPPVQVTVPVLVPGSPVPLLRNVVLAGDEGARFELSSFAAGWPSGWYVFYAVIVGTGRDPADPRQWVASSFLPLLLTRNADQ